MRNAPNLVAEPSIQIMIDFALKRALAAAEELTSTATNGRYLKPYAKILLALAARREKKDDPARNLLRELNEEFPPSPLFSVECALVTSSRVSGQVRARPCWLGFGAFSVWTAKIPSSSDQDFGTTHDRIQIDPFNGFMRPR